MNALELIIKNNPNKRFLKADGLDDAVMDYRFDEEKQCDRLVYSIQGCIAILMRRDGMDYEEAQEFLDFNTIGAYVGDMTPIFIYE